MTTNKTIKLTRLNHNEPDFPRLDAMGESLREFLENPAYPADKAWMDDLQEIIRFQAEDGSFRMFDTYEVPSDARVAFCHMPTYICTAALMKAYLTDRTLVEEEVLRKALKACGVRNLTGHGYDGFSGQIAALEVFRKGSVREFLMYHGDLCPAFTRMMKGITAEFREREEKENFLGSWKEDYERDIRTVNDYFAHSLVFVYGTLLQGEGNHSRYLQDDWLVGRAAVSGYDMFDIGCFPGVIAGEGRVLGEVYEVDADDMKALDRLEGEGSLYLRKCVPVTMETGNVAFASIYVYNGSTDGLDVIPEWAQPYTADWREKLADLVWYVSYGSNMLEERFLHYIEGGAFAAGGAYHESCVDTTAPRMVRPCEIPYDMYFRNRSGSWGGRGVSFLDITRPGRALGVAYLITREQFDHVARQENGGCAPEYSTGWYDTVVSLGLLDGCEVMTITNSRTENDNRPSKQYVETLRRGLKEHYPQMSAAEIAAYLEKCERNGRQGLA